jgi:hypothetical protein
VDLLPDREAFEPIMGAAGELGTEWSGEVVSSSPLRSTFCFAFATAWFKSPPTLFFANKADSLGACGDGLKVEGAALLEGEGASGRAAGTARFFVGLRLEVGSVAPGWLKGCTAVLVETWAGAAEATDARAGVALGAPFAMGMLPASAGRFAISASSRRRPQSMAAWSCDL